MLDTIHQHLPQIEALCRKHHVDKLWVFGSAVGDDFDPERSDLDFLVEFDARYHPWNDYWELQEALSSMFNRRVDLVDWPCIRNPYVYRSIEQSRKLLYAA